jgi:hypothetical protein
MLIDRRSVLQAVSGVPVAAGAVAALAHPPTEQFLDAVVETVGVTAASGSAALARLTGPLGPFVSFARPIESGLAEVWAPQPYWRRWAMDRADLGRSVAVLSRDAALAIEAGDATFRTVGSCAFGGLVVAILQRRRGLVGLIAAGGIEAAPRNLAFTRLPNAA